jgi:hypothetical protein
VLVFNHKRMADKFRRVAAAQLLRADHETEAHRSRRMPFPTRWDPFFMPVMTIAYPIQHFEFRRKQLSAGLVN